MAKRKNRYGKKNIEMYAVYQVSYFFGAPSRWPIVCWPTVKQCREFIDERKDDGIEYMVEAMPSVIKAWDGTSTEHLDPNIR